MTKSYFKYAKVSIKCSFCDKEYNNQTDEVINKLMTLHFKLYHKGIKYDPNNSKNIYAGSLDDSKGANDYDKIKQTENTNIKKQITKYENTFYSENKYIENKMT